MTLRPLWTFLKLYVFKQGFRDGVEGFMFCALSGVSVAVRAWKRPRAARAGEGLMIAEHEAVVADRFDALCGRFKCAVAADDPRLVAIIERLSPLEGRRILDLGCGKGRFARSLIERGAQVVGLDLSAGMLAQADGVSRVRGSARRLPFGRASFDAVMAVEVFEHLAPEAIDRVCGEVLRVLEPGGTFVVIDKNAWSWNARSPVAAERGGEVDRRAPGSVDVRARRSGARALVRAAGAQARGWAAGFRVVRVWHLLSESEAGRFPFRVGAGYAADGFMGGEGAGGSAVTELSIAQAGITSVALVENSAGARADPRAGRGAVRDGEGRASAVVPRGAVRAL